MNHPNNKPRANYQVPDFISRQIKNGDYYFLDLKEDSGQQLSVVCGGLEYCSSDYHIERKRFPYYCIEYIATGNCSLTLDGKEHSLSAGSLFCYGPNTPHSIRNTGTTPLLKYFIDFTGPDAPKQLQGNLLSKNHAPNFSRQKWVSETFQSIQDCGKTTVRSGRVACAHLLRYLVARLEDCVQKEVEAECLTSSCISFKNIRTYIETNYAQITSPHQVAEACNISHQYLCRLFKKFTDETPTQMIMRLKLRRSMDLLEEGNLLVKQVAEKVGFDDQYYFSKCFKDFYGQSPRNYLNGTGVKLSA